MSRPAKDLALPPVGAPLPLPFEPAVAPAAAAPATFPARRQARAEHWVAICLPTLVLDAHIDSPQREQMAAVVADENAQLLIRAVTPSAAGQGVATGMTLSGALALVPELRLYTFFPERVVQYREALAAVLQQLTPVVVLDDSDALLLEVGASLTLFGGLSALLTKLTAVLREQGGCAATAVAPTPRAALWLARGKPGAMVDELPGLDSALRDLPLAVLGWPVETVRRLAAMGVRTLGACRRLPRAGLAKRFGPALLLALDRAYGVVPDPRQAWDAPQYFESRLELMAEISDTARLAGAAAVLLERLARFARRRQRCVRSMTFGFFALDAPATERTLRPGILAQEVGHWQSLLELDLESARFAAPTIMIELVAAEFEPLRVRSGRLAFDGERAVETQAAATGLLLERLCARLGKHAVVSPRLVADHRPERAMQLADPQAPVFAHATTGSPWHELALTTASRLTLVRPLWLLATPCLLTKAFDQRTTFEFRHGPERIEGGWWDGADIARDYYVARTSAGAHAWVFRERESQHPHWYLHGLFG